MNATIAALRPVSAQVWVGGGLRAGDAGELRALGFAWLVNHRPDGEEPGQSTAAEIADAAVAAGLQVIHAPVRGLPDAAAVTATRAILDAMAPGEKAVFVCRSGMRSAAAWAMAERLGGADPGRLREAAAAAGYDLGRLPL
jgi:uncharacterized protein (TIGR01244 family)